MVSTGSIFKCLPGSGLKEFIEQFEQSYKKEPFSTCLIVPTSRLRKEILHQFEQKGSPIITTSVVTLKNLAQKIFSDDSKKEILISSHRKQLD